MKILIIGNEHYTIPAVDGGAIEKLVEYYLEYISEKKDCNNYFTVYSPFSKNQKENNSEYVEYRYINKSSLNYKGLRIIKKIEKIIKKNNLNRNFISCYLKFVFKDLKKKNELQSFDHIIIENEISMIIPVRKMMKGKLFLHLHNDYLNCNVDNCKVLYDSVDKIICVSQFIKKRVEEIDNKEKAEVLYNGIDVDMFSTKISNEEKEKIAIRYNLNLKEDYIILYTGRLMPEKGVLELVKAFNKVKKIKENVKLIIVGGNRDEKKVTDSYIDLLKKEIEKNSDSIIMTGKISNEDVKKISNISKIQVVPSMWEEAFGLVVLEGMATENALIVSNSGGMPELVNKNTGIIVNRENLIEEIKNGILFYIDNEEKRIEFILAAKKNVEKFSKEKYCKNFDKLLK